MKAKDKKAILQEIWQKFPGMDDEMDIDWEVGEIFYKAGYEQSVLDNDNWANETYGYRKGIKEVVEWIEATSKTGHPSKFIPSFKWQSQLKEWGIK